MVEHKLKSKTYLYINADNVIRKNVQSILPRNTALGNTQDLQVKSERKCECLDAHVTNRGLYKALKDLVPLDGNI
jgi:hypothetical protein